MPPTSTGPDLTERRTHATTHGWITTEEAATRLGITARTARIWADHGRLTVFRTPGGDTRGGWRSYDATQVDALARLLHDAPRPLRWAAPPLNAWKPTPP